jgi:hypothetical protein
VEDWFAEGLDGRSERTSTLYAGLLDPLLKIIGAQRLRDLTAGNVGSSLGQLSSAPAVRPDLSASAQQISSKPAADMPNRAS